MKIIYPASTGIAVIFPTGELPIEEVARKDVPLTITYEPTGTFETDEETGEQYEVMRRIETPTPYLFVEDSVIPADWSFQAAWEADFSVPGSPGNITINITKAINITKDRLRKEREPLFAKLTVDQERSGGDPAKLAAIEAERQRLRDLPLLTDRPGITLDELKSLHPQSPA